MCQSCHLVSVSVDNEILGFRQCQDSKVKIRQQCFLARDVVRLWSSNGIAALFFRNHRCRRVTSLFYFFHFPFFGETLVSVFLTHTFEFLASSVLHGRFRGSVLSARPPDAAHTRPAVLCRSFFHPHPTVPPLVSEELKPFPALLSLAHFPVLRTPSQRMQK